MEVYSKAAELKLTIAKQNALIDHIKNNRDQVDELNKTVSELIDGREKFNYQNPAVVIAEYDEMIADGKVEREQYAQSQADFQLTLLQNHRMQLLANYTKLSGWYLKKKERFTSGVDVVQSCVPRFFHSDSEIVISNSSLVLDRNGKGKYLLYGILFLLFGPAILAGYLTYYLVDYFFDMTIPAIIAGIAAGCGVFGAYISWLGGLTRGHPFLEKLPVILLVIGILFIIMEIFLSHTSLKKDADMYLAVIDPGAYKSRVHDQIINDYEATTLREMNIEREQFLTSGVPGKYMSERITSLTGSYNEFSDVITRYQEEIDTKEKSIAEAEAQVEALEDKYNQIAATIGNIVTDPSYNNGVLTDVIAVRMHGEGSDLGTYMHRVSPIFFTYAEEKYPRLEYLYQFISDFIAEVYHGFISDNYYGIVDIRVIDFETGGVLISGYLRELYNKEFLRYYSNMAESQRLYDELTYRQSLIMGLGGTGDISTANPGRLAAGDSPFAYIITFHFGKNACAIPQDKTHFYMGGRKIGFMPIFIMSNSEYQQLMKNEHDPLYALALDSAQIEMEWE